MKQMAFFSLIFISPALHAKTLYCSGTEPFWSASINLNSGRVEITEPTISTKVVAIDTQIMPAANRIPENIFVAKGKDISLTVIKHGNCSDGMSDTQYNYTVIMTGYSNSPYHGCCDL